MCGITGITWPDCDLVARMTAAVAHRGPDDEGVYFDDDVTLGHRRLSIIDLSPDGHQPLSNEDGSIWLVFNGEIYNFRELRHQLEQAGHAFRSRSDSEVILHAYEQYGFDCLTHLRGMFAFALWDRNTRTLMLARDRLGIKPLYFAETPDGLAFASEVKALLQCPSVDRRVDPQGIYHFVGYECVPEPDTAFRAVRALEPGTWLRYRGGHVEIRRYWDLAIAPIERTRREHEAVLRDALADAVRTHLVSDVPIGVFLSGGLDSSAIVASMHEAGVSPIRTYSLGYADQSFSELPYARIVSRAFGTEHHELIIDPITPNVIEEAIWHLDTPMSDLAALPFYLLCKQVRSQVTVCLSGEGGDETLVGYDRFKASKAHRYYALLPRWMRHQLVAPLARKLPDRPQKKGAINMFKRFVEGGLLPAEGEHMRWQYFGDTTPGGRLFSQAFKADVTFDPFEPIRRHLADQHFKTALDREIYLDTRFAMVGNPLFKVDRMSMAHGLEVRVPMLDHQFVEACATIPGRLKLEGFRTKAVFRTAMKGLLPDTILNRGKQGYSIPIKNWLRLELRDFMMDTFRSSAILRDWFDMDYVETLVAEHQQHRANHNHVLWALLNLAVWHRLFVEAWTSPAAPVGRPAPPRRLTAHRVAVAASPV